MNKKDFKRFEKQFSDAIVDSHDRLGDTTAIVDKARILEICRYLHDDEKMAFDMLSDLTAVDYLQREPRFEVVYHLYSVKHGHRIRLRVPVAEGDERVDSVTSVWRSANWAEREAWDMFGIRFEGHPDLRRILMYEEFVGHPLRKDYPIQKSQPRMDLVRKERDAVEEYTQIHAARQNADEG